MKRHDTVQHALEIAEEYKAQGLTLTLRQMYYQFVARGLTESGQQVYKRIGAALTEARYQGDYPIHLLEDRGRTVNGGDFTRFVADEHISMYVDEAREMAKALPAFLAQRSRWCGQETHVSVWVEKEALSGVFEDPCTELGVNWFACKGYSSVSSLFAWLRRVDFAVNGAESAGKPALRRYRSYQMPRTPLQWTEVHQQGPRECVVLYFGDHDPDGWEIPRSAERNLRRLMDTYGMDVPLRFERVALNMDQIQKYNPPPFDAKMTSTRYAGYVDEHDTDNAWELDALDPATLRQLIRDRVGEYFDEDVAAIQRRAVRGVQGRLRQRLGDVDLFSEE